MVQVEEPQQNPPPTHPSSLFSEHLKCSICLEMLRIPVMTAIGCGHRFCETDIKMAAVVDRRCPLCREEIRELFHDVFAEQILEDYYKFNPNAVPRERCPPWTGPDPLVNVQVMAPALSQAERDEISGNIIHIIDRENRFNEFTGLPSRPHHIDVEDDMNEAEREWFQAVLEDEYNEMLNHPPPREPVLTGRLVERRLEVRAERAAEARRRMLLRQLARRPFARPSPQTIRSRDQMVPPRHRRLRQTARMNTGGTRVLAPPLPESEDNRTRTSSRTSRTRRRLDRTSTQERPTVLRSGRIVERPAFYGST